MDGADSCQTRPALLQPSLVDVQMFLHEEDTQMREKGLDALLRAAEPLIELAVAEDIGPGDATSEATLAADAVVQGRIRAKSGGVVAGLALAQAVFQRVDLEIEFVAHVGDGQEVAPGELVAEVTGLGRSVLAAERTALNFLQRMSGVATLTRRFVDAVACTSSMILDTRKTLPVYRELDKYAVRMGGGMNHRMSLFDMILIKDNHIDAAGGLRSAVERARAAYPALPIEVEVRTLDELRQALEFSPPLDRIMLDNMSLDEMRRAVEAAAGRVPLEASGNVTLERAPEIAATGVDYISVGALTHSAKALDLSMKVSDPGRQTTPAHRAVRVAEIRSAMGERLLILGHHYQRDEVIACADFRGDSLKLARDATQTEADFIVFCGVHFMAETAAILAKPGQSVLIPDMTAGCYLADTATPEDIQHAWEHLDAVFGDAEAEFTPITYVNSSAALKAFCGRHGGITCTSSNAERVMNWALARRARIFFFPDQHLGRNTAKRMEIPLEEMLLWNAMQLRQLPQPPSAGAIRQARVILWPGACNVHQRFRPEHVRAVRDEFPGIQVLVHPECRMEVVDLADGAGSTAHIIDQIRTAPPGTRWAIGTETRLVRRLQQEHPEQQIRSLADVSPFCRTMGQITLHNLTHLLDNLAKGVLVNQVLVDAETAHWARIALERMLSV
jgi:quinolinate synthase